MEPPKITYQLVETTHKKALILPPSGQQPQDMDSAFWIGVHGGLGALTHHDAWIATLRLEQIIAQLVLPLAAQYLGLAPGTARDAQHNPHLAEFASRWQHQQTGATLWSAYRALIEDYRRLRMYQRLPPSPLPHLENQVLVMLDIGLRATAPDLHEVLSWRSLSIVLPAYNEEEVIADTVSDCLRAMRRFCPNGEVIIVDDGSRDRTGAISDDMATNDARVVVIHNQPNKGYGGALLAGFNGARGELTFFMDSDGQFDINDIAKLLAQYERHPGAIVLGYRAQRRDPFMRKMNAWGWKQVSRLVLGLHGIKDIDCAFKLFPTRVMRACEMHAQGASVNAEFLTKFQRMRLPIYQIPVQHLPRTKGNPTGAKLAVIVRAFKEILRLRSSLAEWEHKNRRGNQQL